MSKTVILEPKESQDLYDFILGKHKTGMPETKKVREGAILTAEQLEDVYNIVADNRAKTRGTRLYFEVTDDGDVSKIEYAEIKIPPQEIVTPRFKICGQCDKQFENVLPRCPKCGWENQR